MAKTPQRSSPVRDEPRAKSVSAQYRTEINITHEDINIGNGDVRVAAWIARDKPYRVDNTLVNDTTDGSGTVIMEHLCEKGTEILIRARAANMYIGPTRDVLYISPGMNDKIDIQMIKGRGI